MARLNRTVLIGRVGHDPKIESFPSGDQCTRVSLATDESYTDKKTGQKHELTEWHPLEFTGTMAKTAADYIKKGALIYVEAKLRTYKIIPDGAAKPVTQHTLRANNFQLLSSPLPRPDPHPQPQNSGGYQPAPNQPQVAPNAAQPPDYQYGYWHSNGTPFNPQQQQEAYKLGISMWQRGQAPSQQAFSIQGVF